MFRQLLFCFVFFCALFFLIHAEEEEEKAPNLTLEQKNQILRDKLEALRQGQIVWKENLEASTEEAKQKQQRIEELEQEQEKILERLKQQEEKNFLLKEETIKILEDLNTLKTRERERVVQEKNRFHEQEEEKKKQEERSKDKDELISRFGEITNNLNKKAFDSLRELSDLVEKERRAHESCQRMLESTTETADGLLRLEQITQLRLKNEALEYRLEEERKKQAELEVKLAARDRDCRKGARGGSEFSFPQYPPQVEQVVVLLKPYLLPVYPYLTKGVNILKALQVELQIFLAGIPSVKANSMIVSKVIVYGAATSLVLFVFLFLYAICFGGGQKSQKKKGE